MYVVKYCYKLNILHNEENLMSEENTNETVEDVAETVPVANAVRSSQQNLAWLAMRILS